jgi:tRNA(fMet)-specific endonuclease VapC
VSANSPSERFLLDTTILVHWARGDELAKTVDTRYQLSVTPAVPLISIVTAGELHSLAAQWSWGTRRIHELERLIDDLVVIPLDYPGIVQAYAEIDAFCLKRGLPRGENDMWIAATANVTGARLLTTDKDFSGLDPTYIRCDWIDPQKR